MSPPKTFLILNFTLCIFFHPWIFIFYDFFMLILSCSSTTYLHAPFTPTMIHQSLFKLLYISGSCYITVTIRYPLLCFYSIYPGDYTETQNLRQIFVIKIYVCMYFFLFPSKVIKYSFMLCKSIHNSFSHWIAADIARQMQVMRDGGISHYSTK